MAAGDQGADPLHALFQGARRTHERRHHAQREVVVRGDLDLAGHRVFRQLVGQIRCGGDAGEPGGVGKAPQRVPLAHVQEAVLANRPVGQGAQRGPLQLAGGFPGRILHHAHDVGVAGDARAAHELAVDVDDVPALVHYQHGAGGGDPVQIRGQHAPAAEEDGIEAPAQHGLLRIGQPVPGLGQALYHGVDARKTRVHHPIRRHALVEADVRILPRTAFPAMTVAFHQAGHDDLVGEAIVHLMGAPARQLLEGAGAEHVALTHRHVTRTRPARVHGDDGAGRVDGETGHQNATTTKPASR